MFNSATLGETLTGLMHKQMRRLRKALAHIEAKNCNIGETVDHLFGCTDLPKVKRDTLEPRLDYVLARFDIGFDKESTVTDR